MSTIKNSIFGSPRRTALFLAALGVLVRVALALWLGISDPPEAGSDSELYDTYAWNLAQGRGFRGMSPDVADQDHLTACVVPGTSLVWAGIYAVVGHRYDVIRLAHCIFGGIAVFFVFEIGARSYGNRVGIISSAIYAVFPTAVLFSVALMSEALSNLFFLAFILATLWFGDRPSWGRCMISGFLLGAVMLTRPSCVFMFPLVVVWGVWQLRGQWRSMLQAAAIPIVAIAVIAPWAARNYKVFHEFIPFSTLGGATLLGGNNDVVVTDPLYFGYSVWDSTIPEYREALQTAGDEVERDRRARRFAVEWIKNHPEKWAFMVYHKTRRAFTPFLQPHTPRLHRVSMLVSWGPVLVLFVLAFVPTFVNSLRSGQPQWLLHLAIAQYLLISIVFFGMTRYRQPVEPLCIILAVQGVALLVQRLTPTGRSVSI
jgi:4-amino-4-deoxy-L-arabinose transferase-like glycosyltransferase